MSKQYFSFYSLYGFAGFLIVIIFVMVLLLAVVKNHSRKKAENQKAEEEMETEIILSPVNAVYATVLKKDVSMEKNVVSVEKIVRTHKLVYAVQFLTDDGEIVEYSVPEELYDYITIGQKGILATVDGEFFDFGDGEEISI